MACEPTCVRDGGLTPGFDSRSVERAYTHRFATARYHMVWAGRCGEPRIGGNPTRGSCRAGDVKHRRGAKSLSLLATAWEPPCAFPGRRPCDFGSLQPLMRLLCPRRSQDPSVDRRRSHGHRDGPWADFPCTEGKSARRHGTGGTTARTGQGEDTGPPWSDRRRISARDAWNSKGDTTLKGKTGANDVLPST